MGTTTKKIKKKTGTRTNTRVKLDSSKENQPAGRRGGAASSKTSSIHMDEIPVPEADLMARGVALTIDVIFIFALTEVLYYREAYSVIGLSAGTFTSKAIIHMFVFLTGYLIPLRIFGQSLGMKLRKIKILTEEDLSYVKFNTLLQRQTAGMILNITAGATKLMQKRKVLADEY